MNAWQIGLAAWGGLSIPLALALGRVIHRREAEPRKPHHARIPAQRKEPDQ